MKIWQAQKGVNLWKKLTSGSTNRKILGAALTVGSLTGLVKVAAVAKELVVAWRFGTGDALDAFLIALIIPAFVINVLAGSFNAALIPTYIQVREQEGKQAALELFCSASVWGIGFLTIVTILMVATTPLYLPKIASGFSPEKLKLTFWLLCTLAPYVILSGLIITWGAVLNAGERFALAAFSPILTPIISILLLVFMSSWGPFALVIGLLGGALLELVLLGIALHKQGISIRPRWFGFNPHIRRVASQYFPAAAGGLLMCSAVLVDQAMAAMLSPGSVSALNYGNRVISLPLTLSTTALSTAVIPYFSKMVAVEDWQGVSHTLKYYLRSIFAAAIPLTVIFILFAQPIVQILFQRGSFSAIDTQSVSQIQSLFALQIPFYLASDLLVRLIFSMQANHLLVWVSAFNLTINIALNYILMQWIGLKGIALSTSCVYLFSFLYLLFFTYKNLKKMTVRTLN